VAFDVNAAAPSERASERAGDTQPSAFSARIDTPTRSFRSPKGNIDWRDTSTPDIVVVESCAELAGSITKLSTRPRRLLSADRADFTARISLPLAARTLAADR